MKIQSIAILYLHCATETMTERATLQVETSGGTDKTTETWTKRHEGFSIRNDPVVVYYRSIKRLVTVSI